MQGFDSMNQEEVEQYLTNNFQLGFVKPTGSPDYLGWVLLTKMTPQYAIPNYDSLDPAEDADLIRELDARREYIRQHPYFVRVVELNRAVHESGTYETEEDYRQKHKYYFATLDGVEAFFRAFGYSFATIKTGRDIDAP